MSAHFEILAHRLKTGVSPVELVYSPHDRWPLPRRPISWPHGAERSKLRISVLDSSFNPPTLAHRALAEVPLPTSSSQGNPASLSDTPDFDARLLLLSVRNADKVLKATDATYDQRMEMMILLAKDIIAESSLPSGATSCHRQNSLSNIAMGIIDEPTFVGKSRILGDFLQSRITSLSRLDEERLSLDQSRSPRLSIPAHTVRPQLTFVVGIDTLERIVSPRYYPSDESMRTSLTQFLSVDGDDSYIICARRTTPGLLVSHDERERAVLRSAAEYTNIHKVIIVDIGEMIQSYSSSEVRERIRSGDQLWTRMITPSIAEYVRANNLYAAEV